MALTIEQIQANITAKADAREIINQIADYIEANPGGGGGGSSYLSYIALLSQSGTNAPTVEQLITNTLGVTITWTRTGVGEYKATASGNIFTNNKTIFPPLTDNVGGTSVPIYTGSGPFGAGYTIYINSASEAIMLFSLANGSSAEWSTIASATKIFVEIRVYP